MTWDHLGTNKAFHHSSSQLLADVMSHKDFLLLGYLPSCVVNNLDIN